MTQAMITRHTPPDAVPVLDDDPFSEDVLRDPIPFQRRLREAGPLVWLSNYGFYAVGRVAEIEKIMLDWQTFTSARGIGPIDLAKQAPWWRERAVLIESDPPRHNEIRVRVARVLSGKVLDELRPDFERQAEALLDRVLQADRFDAQKELAIAYPLKVFGDALGIDGDQREMLLVFGDMGFNNFGPDNDVLKRSMERGKKLGAVEWMMARTDRKSVRPGSLGDRLHALAEDGALTPAEAWNVMRGQLTAGVDTTIAAMGHILLSLAQNPAQYALLRADPSLARSAFEEAARHLSPIQHLFRTITTDTAIGGTPARKDHKIFISIAAANRDPAKWERPDTFDLQRRTDGHLAFGRGAHVCVGNHIARLEAECLLNAFARRVATLSLDGVPEYKLNNTVRSLAHLPVKIARA